jgi:hypothetical protein
MTRLATRTHLAVTERIRRMREEPDRGSDTVERIMWVAIIIIVVAAIGLIFKNKITAYANNLDINLGF